MVAFVGTPSVADPSPPEDRVRSRAPSSTGPHSADSGRPEGGGRWWSAQSFGIGAWATQRTPVLPSWSAITTSDGASLSSTTIPPAANRCRDSLLGHLRRHIDLDVEPLMRRLVLVGVTEPQIRYASGGVTDLVAGRPVACASAFPVNSAAHTGAIVP